MIVHNDFREFQHVAEEVDRRLYYTNLYIKRGSKNEVPRNESGRIIINDTDDEGYFGGELVHEAGHTVFDPVSAKNWVTCAYKIREALGVDQKTAICLANIASDLIVEWKIKDDKVLSSYRRRSVEVVYRRFYGKADPVRKELFGIYKKLHKCRYEADSRLYEDVASILSNPLPRERKYIELASLFYSLMRRSGVAPENDQMINMPIRVNEKEARRIVQQIMAESSNAEEAKEKLELLTKICNKPDELKEMKRSVLRHFYEAKARLVRMSVAYPQERTQRGIKIGSRRWRPEYGWKMIDIKRTVMKYGTSIPLVTTQSPRIVNKFVSSIENQKPCDLVISIDTSASTGIPDGYMDEVADYEVVMFYALVDLAKKLNQRVGLTLWSGYLVYTTLPEVYDWRRLEKLKDVILTEWSGASTEIIHALMQAEEHPDKLFFVFTDGEVSHKQLIDVDNVMFFLIKPARSDLSAFVEKYGKDRVIVINSLDNIPKVTVQQYVKLFMR
ncbi:MAG: hypothetical protein DRJ03_22755 [Chloroflexi bacterium]|nr:MAG: hypothetical protein DRJ03_22755 [Chloroflexota bacterium]